VCVCVCVCVCVSVCVCVRDDPACSPYLRFLFNFACLFCDEWVYRWTFFPTSLDHCQRFARYCRSWKARIASESWKCAAESRRRFCSRTHSTSRHRCGLLANARTHTRTRTHTLALCLCLFPPFCRSAFGTLVLETDWRGSWYPQRALEDAIRDENIEQLRQNALEHMPESFAQGSIVMLYIDVVVNGMKLKAFVDSGAQMTIMSSSCAERTGLMRLVDRRFQVPHVGGCLTLSIAPMLYRMLGRDIPTPRCRKYMMRGCVRGHALPEWGPMLLTRDPSTSVWIIM
jgi:hypothetical protein